MKKPTTWLGDTPELRRQTLGLLGVLVVVSPFIVAAELGASLRLPFLRGQKWPAPKADLGPGLLACLIYELKQR